jgi:lysophospholipase L1-like esterase
MKNIHQLRSKRTIMKKRIILAYSISMTLLLGFVLLECDFVQRVERKLGIAKSQTEITGYFHQRVRDHTKIDVNVLNQSLIFIGDSIMHRLPVSAVASPAVNYGIESDTTVGVLLRLPTYKSIKNARAVVIAIGVNDMKYRSNGKILHNFKEIAKQIPSHVPVIFSAILPVDLEVRDEWMGINNDRIRKLNSKLKDITETSENLFFVNAGTQLTDEMGNLADEFHNGDGVHLNPQGNAIWISKLQNAIEIIRLNH